MGARGARYMREHFSWEAQLARLQDGVHLDEGRVVAVGSQKAKARVEE